MLAKIHSGAVVGIDARRIDVEVDVSIGMQVFHIVGLPDGAVREARLRVPAAMKNAGLTIPLDKITVNLAPADLRKDGAGFDLALALGILCASGQLDAKAWGLERWVVLGELGLDGSVRPVRGVLPVAVMARDEGFDGVIVPRENAGEAAIVRGVKVLPVDTIAGVLRVLRGDAEPEWASAEEVAGGSSLGEVDFDEVAGQEGVKRALEVAAAGGHNILMVGPPGSGKSMLARRLPTILPPMGFEEAPETTKVYSVTGQLDGGLLRARPFRSPHHTISDVGIVGGGSGTPRPGEVSLAHNGVLFLDELPEFKKNVLEVMRQPLEESAVTITRSLTTLTYPASVMLVAAMNPCKCGYFGSDHIRRCTCPVDKVRAYRAKISGPLMDRIDIHVEVPVVGYEQLRRPRSGHKSKTIRARVVRARARQSARFVDASIHSNAQMSAAHMREHCVLTDDGHRLLERVVDQLGMSARACNRIIKVARTIADLAGREDIGTDHLAEAIQYRALDRGLSASRARRAS